MSRLQAVLDRLEGVRPSGASYMALCPAHEDRSPSLRIREADDGRILLFCLASCETGDILSAIGLSMTDLYPPRSAHERTQHRKTALRRDLEAALERERLILLMAHNAAGKLSDADKARATLAETRIRKIHALIKDHS